MAEEKFGGVHVHTTLDAEGFAVDVIAEDDDYTEEDWTTAVRHAADSVPPGYVLDWQIAAFDPDRWSAGYRGTDLFE